MRQGRERRSWARRACAAMGRAARARSAYQADRHRRQAVRAIYAAWRAGWVEAEDAGRLVERVWGPTGREVVA
jgi:hypothetical protein